LPRGVYERKLSRDKPKNTRIDITGERFGKLVALYPTKPYEKDGKTQCYYWMFKCDCGNEKEILLSSVRRRKDSTKTCGCKNRVATAHLGSKEKVDFIRSGLRSLWLKWPPRYHAKAAAKLRHGVYLCAGYEVEPHEARAKDIHIDHIEPVGEISDWGGHIDKLFCPATNLQVLCKECHNKKTAKERSLAAEVRKNKKEQDEL